MNLRELSTRVNYAKELHTNKSLSDMIQRALEDKRSKEIAAYLKDNSDRFFNSLVVAVYDGEPNWHPLSDVKSRYDTQPALELSEETIESVGFLTLRGDEKLFALDGQHRLAGIKRAIRDGMALSDDEISVIFLGHRNTADGIEATRCRTRFDRWKFSRMLGMSLLPPTNNAGSVEPRRVETPRGRPRAPVL